MTEAEIMEKLNQKRAALEQAKSTNSSQVATLEKEIKELESSLTEAQGQPKRKRRTAFLDECAG